MSELLLVEPTQLYREFYIEMIEEWKATGETMVPFVLRLDYRDFNSLLAELKKLRDDPNPNEYKVNSSTFWLMKDRSRILGAVNIRHRLDSYLLEAGLHKRMISKLTADSNFTVSRSYEFCG
jgi:predicted acetyltransferase